MAPKPTTKAKSSQKRVEKLKKAYHNAFNEMVAIGNEIRLLQQVLNLKAMEVGERRRAYEKAAGQPLSKVYVAYDGMVAPSLTSESITGRFPNRKPKRPDNQQGLQPG